MAYLPEERNVTKILKMEHAFHSVEKEFENDFCIYVKATLKNLEDFSVSPFVKNMRKMTEEQRQEISERMKRVLSKIS